MRFLRRPSSYILFAAAAFFLAPAAHADVRPGSGGACNFSRSAFFCSDAEEKAKAVVQFCLQTNAQQCVAAGGDFQQAAAHPNTYRESSSLTSCSMAAQMSWECRTRRNSQNDATGGCQTSAVADNCAAADTAARWDAIECLWMRFADCRARGGEFWPFGPAQGSFDYVRETVKLPGDFFSSCRSHATAIWYCRNPLLPCGQSGQVCGGTCVSGAACGMREGRCQCLSPRPAPATQCGGDFPACNGACPHPSFRCTNIGLFCTCVAIVPPTVSPTRLPAPIMTPPTPSAGGVR